jgi:hypothetical protein
MFAMLLANRSRLDRVASAEVGGAFSAPDERISGCLIR